MLVELYKRLSPERQVMLRDVALNPQFRALIDAEVEELKEDQLNEAVSGVAPTDFYNTVMPLKVKLEAFAEMKEFLAYVRAEFEANQST